MNDPPPVRALTLQTWSELTFVHWAYEPEQVRRLLPKGLELDTYNGQAWVGLVPFLLTVRPPARRLPPLLGASGLPETNVRTYARDRKGRSGVWFLSLDTTRRRFVAAARLSYRLPYVWSDLSVAREGAIVSYGGSRRQQPGGYVLRVEIAPERLPPEGRDRLVDFLTIRWRLYTVIFGRIFEARVAHEPWPLHAARLLECEQDLLQAAGLPAPVGEPIAQYAPEIEVRVGPPWPV